MADRTPPVQYVTIEDEGLTLIDDNIDSTFCFSLSITFKISSKFALFSR